MKKLIISVLFTMIACYSYSQWTWSNPTPFGYHLYDVHFPDENTGYIVGEKGTVLKTTDAGTSWNFIPSGTLRRLELVWFTDTETGFVTSDSGFIMKTTDGGETWQELQSGTTEEFNDIYFYNETLGFIAGMHGQLLRTTDGGETWHRAFIDIYSNVYSVHFVNENIGYAAASMRTVYKTIDGGDTWSSTSGDPYLNLRSIFFLDAFKGYVAGSDNFMMKTTNGGFSWTHFQSNRPIEQMQFIDEQTAYALSYDDLVKTTNGGTTWNPVGLADVNTYFFANSSNVFGVGSFGKLFRSEDAGVTCINYNPSVTDDNLQDVHFPDANTGYIVSQYDESTGLRYGKVLKTTDAGETWQITADGDFGRLTSVYFTDVNTGYMVSLYGNIYKTTDGGFVWDTLESSYDNYLIEIVFTNSNTGFIAGNGNNHNIILKTSDAGQTWSTTYESDGALRGIHFVNENTGFAIHSNSIIKTPNGGIDWIEIPIENEGILLDVFFVNQNVGYVCGFMGDFFKTTDGGETWSDLSGQFKNTLINMYFIDENTGYMSGDGGTFFQTNNGGTNWAKTGPSSLASSSLWFTDDLTGYAVGPYGTILKTTNGGQVFSESHKIPETGFNLFPNPSNSTITINAEDITNGLPVNISVLNCNGTQVIKGKHCNLPVQMDVSSLATGIYFLRIETANAVETRKLVKM
ncbi:MAG: YCF48-related protein [Bacteroidota bacterium]